jgi:hypothetical protein
MKATRNNALDFVKGLLVLGMFIYRKRSSAQTASSPALLMARYWILSAVVMYSSAV